LKAEYYAAAIANYQKAIADRDGGRQKTMFADAV
jgi:hypothetical protein